VVAAESLAGAGTADAANGNNVALGQNNYETAGTFIEFDSASGQSDWGAALWVTSASVDAFFGIIGAASTTASVDSSVRGGVGGLGGPIGVFGDSPSGEGVYARAGSSYGTNPGGAKNGVHGVTDSATDSAVWGENVGNGYGVSSVTTSSGDSAPAACEANNNGSGPAVRAVSAQGTGVYGQSGATASNANTPSPHGVHGVTDASGYLGVLGENLNGGIGVQGTSLAGSNSKGVLGVGATGVYGLATSGGTGVVASSSFDGTGNALNCLGPAQFELSGLATVRAGKQQVTIAGVSLRATSLVLATPQNNVGVYVVAAIPNVANSKITIVLNAVVPASQTAKVAWFIVN
jgi:hypothetical protein